MNDSSEKNFGFSYKVGDKEYSFVVIAPTQEEAQSRVEAMAEAELVGELIPAQSA